MKLRMKLSQTEINKINNKFNQESSIWEQYYASEHYYRLGILDALKALGVSNEQIKLIDTESYYKDWNWENG